MMLMLACAWYAVLCSDLHGIRGSACCCITPGSGSGSGNCSTFWTLLPPTGCGWPRFCTKTMQNDVTIALFCAAVVVDMVQLDSTVDEVFLNVTPLHRADVYIQKELNKLQASAEFFSVQFLLIICWIIRCNQKYTI